MVLIIIVVIIAFQLYFFITNLKRMHQFREIFSRTSSWSIVKDFETDLVNGIDGEGNKIFEAIKSSINKYLGNNSGSVIDFALLKDAVDRHCDSVENDISTQTPIPLYCGLAGTMAGVIFGLWDLLDSDAILTLMGSSGGVINEASTNAADGINSLLSGVALAMVASICGILLTTINSILFKSCKLQEESGKNSFLAWMQSVLLPELPSDTSDALTSLVKNLNSFNNTFATNTSNLGTALSAVNDSYAIQAEIIKNVHDMDVMKMAKSNVKVLQELKECTDKLALFNEYLLKVEGYTKAIHRFESLFAEQENRLYVLEEIRDFFGRHREEIAKTTVDADNTLREALDGIREATAVNVGELNAQFVTQSETFKSILNDEKEAFEKFASEIKNQFSEQMTAMPKLASQLEMIAAIPAGLEKLIERIEKSNATLANEINTSVKHTLQSFRVDSTLGGMSNNDVQQSSSVPGWMKITGWAAVIVIALACIVNTMVSLSALNKQKSEETTAYSSVAPKQVVRDTATTTISSVAPKDTATTTIQE